MTRSLSCILLCFIIYVTTVGCSSGSDATTTDSTQEAPTAPSAKPVSKYPPHVGDIIFDENKDDPEFQPCSSLKIPQYYSLGAKFRVSNKVLLDYFSDIEIPSNQATAYHTIRFLVNCHGQTGRYRTQSMAADYSELQLAPAFTESLMERLIAFDKWPQGKDYYQYLTFKIIDGKIREVLP